jgi:signal transduction histidine kinase
MRKALPLFFFLLLSQMLCFCQSEIASLRAAIPKISDSLRYVDALNRMAMLLYEKDPDSIFLYTKQARAIAERLDYDQGKADALDNLSVFFDVKGNLQLSLKYGDQAYAAYTKLDDTASRVHALMTIAMVYNELGKDSRAIERFKTALNLGKKLQQDSILSLVISNYLLLYPSQFRPGEKKSYISKAKSIATKYKDTRVQLVLDQLIADDLFLNGHQKEGLSLLKNTIDNAMVNKLFYISMDMIIDLGDKLTRKDPQGAARYFKQGLEISKMNEYLIYSQIMARKLFNLYNSEGDLPAAAYYANMLIETHDEREKLNDSSAIDYLDYALKDEQITALLARSKYQNALSVISVIAFLLAITVIVSITQNLQRSKLLNKKITEQNARMKSALGALEQSHAENSRIMQIVAHDLRNPIGGMYSIAKLLLDEKDRTDDDRMMLEMIKTSGEHSLELVNELLQVQQGKEELKKEDVEISEMLHYCVSLLINKAEAKHQQINLHAESFTLPASREKLWRVISNLISNAIKFSPDGSDIEVRTERTAEGLRISVKDFGIGIPPKIQHKIFDMFTEAKRKGTAGEQSFGLGLAISKQIVEAHGGKIGFESVEGRGTTFFVDLPTS